MTKTKITVAAIIVFLILCVGVKYTSTKLMEKKAASMIRLPQVDVGNAFDTETSNTIDAPGRVLATSTVDVIARIQGYVLKQHFKDGDFVKKGQLLYTLDDDSPRIALQKAQADLENAKAVQFKAQKDYERAVELVKSDYVSKSSYDQALAARNSANASVKACIAAVNDAKRLLSYTKVHAPITGKISMTAITVGNYLSSTNMVLTKLVAVDPIFVTYSLDSRIYAQLKNDEIMPNKNQTKDIKVEITLPDGTLYNKTGKADFVDNTISESTGAITLRATFPNPDGTLIPGDFVNVKVYSNKTITALAVPQAAVLQDSEGRYVYIVDEKDTVTKKYITVSGQKDNNWIVSSGITKDDKIVMSGIALLRDGIKVQVRNSDDKEAEAPQNTAKETKE